MTKSLVVATAVAQQLTKEGRWPPADLNKVMGKDYRYDLKAITLFLTEVKARLAPAHQFTFNVAFAVSALQLSAGELTGAIDAATKAGGSE